MKRKSDPAFPVIISGGKEDGGTIWKDGMNLRQWYKGMAMHGLVAHSGWAKDARMDFHRYVAEQAGSIADAMLAEDAASNDKVTK